MLISPSFQRGHSQQLREEVVCSYRNPFPPLPTFAPARARPRKEPGSQPPLHPASLRPSPPGRRLLGASPTPPRRPPLPGRWPPAASPTPSRRPACPSPGGSVWRGAVESWTHGEVVCSLLSPKSYSFMKLSLRALILENEDWPVKA